MNRYLPENWGEAILDGIWGDETEKTLLANTKTK